MKNLSPQTLLALSILALTAGAVAVTIAVLSLNTALGH
jgi:hypothetical protein